VSYLGRLEETGSLLCLGLDPVPSRMPRGFEGVEGAERFLNSFLEAAHSSGLLPQTLKPNLAYFEQYGWRGWKLLESLVERWGKYCLIILDAKRGDIGRSSEAYARTVFETMQADSVTLHPWMGPDSVEPFLSYSPEKGAYLLLRTSNPGGDVLQAGLWEKLFTSIDDWDPGGTMGFVVGATRPAELTWVLANNQQGRPLLIPGVGAQGASASEVMASLQSFPGARRHRINVSSAILYAHEQGRFPETNLQILEKFLLETRL